MEIRFSKSALRALRRSGKGALLRAKIDELAVQPASLAANVKKLQARPEYRLRVQDWRIIFRVEEVSSGSMRWDRAVPFIERYAAVNVQIVEIAGQKMAILPVADYERLIELAEDREDMAAAVQAEQRRRQGEEYLPAEMVDRILSGESALRVWRQHRGLTLEALGQAVGARKSKLSEIENGITKGEPALWRKLAEALNVSSDDILP